VSAKGKGLIKTYWLSILRGNAREGSVVGSVSASSESGDGHHDNLTGDLNPIVVDERTQRMIDWNVDVLQRQLQHLVAMRGSKRPTKKEPTILPVLKSHDHLSRDHTVLDEVKQVIPLSNKKTQYKQRQDVKTVDLSQDVKSQLRDYVRAISAMYRDNPFHSFDHASHVALSVTKLLARVVTPDSIDYNELTYKKEHHKANKLYEYTYGITADPLIPFAYTFSTLIHDVDHQGVPNAQLVSENTEIAQIYKNKSVAEQNSVDIAWDLLMEPSYKDLRDAI